jgi:competence protein ComEC
LWLPVALGAGAALYFALPAEPSFAAAWAAMAAAFAGLPVAVTLRRLRVPLALLAALALGFALAKFREQAVAAPVLQAPAVMHLNARIAAVETSDTGVRLTLSHPISGGFREGRVPARLRVSVRGDGAGLAPGDWVSLTAGLSPPIPPAEPGAADFARAAFFERVGAAGFALGQPTPGMAPWPPDGRERLEDGVAGLRWRTTARIRAALPGPEGAIASALITGMRGGIGEEDEAALRDAGLAHVLAIAGLHMALMGMGLFWLVRALLAASPYLALNHPIRKWAAAAALAGSAFYLILSGAAAPAVRAFVMLAVGLVAMLFDRPALSMRSLALAAAILLLLRPESVTEPGFQMSFAAVAALIAAAESTRGPGRGLLGHLNAIFVTSAVASLATLPFAIFHFGRATHYAVLGNLLAMPVMGLVVMPLATLSVAAMPLGLEAWPLHLLGRGIDLMLALGRAVSRLPGAVSAAPAMPLAALALMSLGGLWLAIWRRRKRWLGLAFIAAGIVVAAAAKAPDMLVAPDAATVAVRGADGLLQFPLRPADRYAARNWLARDGDLRDAGAAIGIGRCDALGCAVRTPAGLTALSRRPESLVEDCAHAAILVSVAAVSCRGPRFIADGPRTAHDQGYALWFTPELRVESVREWRGERPWVAP